MKRIIDISEELYHELVCKDKTNNLDYVERAILDSIPLNEVKVCGTCRSYHSYDGTCDICHDYKCWKEKDEFIKKDNYMNKEQVEVKKY